MSRVKSKSDRKSGNLSHGGDDYDDIARKFDNVVRTKSSSNLTANIKANEVENRSNGTHLGWSSNFFSFDKNKILKQLNKMIVSIDLSKNKIDDVFIDGASSEINCSSESRIQFLRANIRELIALNFQTNWLTSFPKLHNLGSLLSLNLSSNKIEVFPSAEALKSLTHLTQLNLSSNHLQTLSPSIQLLRSLVDLDLSKNSLVSLPDELYELVNLEHLLLNSNSLSEISCAGLSKLTKLKPGKKSLNLTKNRLKVPPQEIADKGIVNILDVFNSMNSNTKLYGVGKPIRQQLITFKLFVLGHDGKIIVPPLPSHHINLMLR
jgi:hypothetical protein